MNEDKSKHVLTDKHFEQFKKYCKKWLRELGLVDWSVCFEFRDSEGEDDVLDMNKAIVWMNREGMVARIVLNTKWQYTQPNKVNLERCALHEVSEILLKPLLVLAESRYNVDSDDIEYEKHRIIRVIENVLVAERCWDATRTGC